METTTVNAIEDVRTLIGQAQASDEPVVVFDGADECLVAMRPAVFERILFDGDLLNCEGCAELSF